MTIHANQIDIGLSVATVAELAQIETGSLLSGDLAFTRATGEYWSLSKSSTQAVSATVIATANSINGAQAGRWLLALVVSPSGTVTGLPLVTVMTTTPYTSSSTAAEEIIVVALAVPAPSTVNLPPVASAVVGMQRTVKDRTGAAANNITISGNGSTIDGAATQTININDASFSMVYAGVAQGWVIV